jgi:hypothetical protein
MAGRLRAEGEPPPAYGECYHSKIRFNISALFDVHCCLRHVFLRKAPFFAIGLGFMLYVEFN